MLLTKPKQLIMWPMFVSPGGRRVTWVSLPLFRPLSSAVRTGKVNLRILCLLKLRDVLQLPWEGGHPDPFGIVAVDIHMDPTIALKETWRTCLSR